MISASPSALGEQLPTLAGRRLTAHRPTLPALTGIRFFAAMAVVLYHSKFPDLLRSHGLRSAGNLIANGNASVALFFVLSGFILAYTYQGQIETAAGKRRFWEARFARIWPLYAFSLLCSSLANHTTPSLARALATLCMVQAWNPLNPNMAGTWNFVCWTLSTEALFYAVFPFLQRWVERRSDRVVFLCLALAAGFSVIFCTGNINFEDTHGIRGIPLAALHLPEFLAGLCCGVLFLRRPSPVPAERAAGRWGSDPGRLSWVALLSSIFFLSHLSRYSVAWVGISFPLLVYGLAAEKSWIASMLSRPTMILGGQISYGIYLLQWPAKTAMNQLCDRLRLHAMPVRFGLYCAGLMLMAYAAYHVIEEPCRRLLRDGFASRERKEACSDREARPEGMPRS